MYIKQIIIQGFKSYKDQTVIEPFSPGHNVIVGRNGSGKSNFFAAIRFVLSDAYTQMSREERAALLHEGSGSAVMSAYVEIIFDNSDERFPTGKPETILRRTIGQKKDEYSLDRKNVTKADVMNLLESAGFSRSNPYYIVPQGRVTTLTNMKDPERLNLLKEVAGTQVYEARRTESIRIMAETDSKRGKIDELLTYISERLDELEEDKKELQEYRDKDREKRCLQYTLFHREQEEINSALEQLEEQRATGIDEDDVHRQRFLTGEAELSKIDDEIKSLKQEAELLNLDKQQYDEERRDVGREKAKVELDVNNTTGGQSAAKSAQDQQQRDLHQVQSAISEREAQLSELLPNYNQVKSREEAAKLKLEDAEAKRQRLYAKQGRSAKFKSKTERDSWLQKEIDDVSQTLAVRKAVSMQAGEEVSELEAGIHGAGDDMDRLRLELDSHGARVDSIAANVQQAKEARDGLLDQRKELWREDARLDAVMRNTQSEMEKAERFLSHMMDQNTSRGLAAVRRIKQQRNLTGVYGTVGELFNVHQSFRTAVEVTAGNSLFHYVVDNDETASQVLEVLNKEHAGRVTFMPLNRLRAKEGNLPKANDAINMLSKLSFDPLYEPAMRQVFGRTIICPSLQVASQYARSHGVNAITPEGDRSDKKGALTGGYHDPRQSRLEAMQNLSKVRTEYESHRARKEQIRGDVEHKDQEITRAYSDLLKAEQSRTQAENSLAPLQQELRSKAAEMRSKRESLESKQRAKSNIDNALKELAEQQTAYENEKKSEFKKALSPAEEQQLEQFSSSIPDLRKEYLDINTSRSELEVQKSTIEVELQEDLRPRLDQLRSMQQDISGTSAHSSNLKELQKTLKRLSKKVETVDAKINEMEDNLEEANTKIAELEQHRVEQRGQQQELAKSIEKHQKRSEKSMAKRSLLGEKAAVATRNVRDLGVLPDEAFDKKYTRVTSEVALKRLHALNETLKKYSHVNKKAFEQYTSFTKQRETLIKRRTELDTSQASIRELIDVLDQRKDEAIERTFKQVSREFASIFERLVPAGRGRLIIQRRNDRDRVDVDGDSDDEAGGARPGGGVENYTGVGISVSFNSKYDEQQRIQQLSGGQKSLCALALVFAIQQCDPAPFYLFDEIDANLDAQYRTAVAALLQEISGGTAAGEGEEDESDTGDEGGRKGRGQFICTTFRPEMLHVAEKCYGVSYENKTSRIDVVSRDEALEFVEKIVGGH